MKLPLCPSWKEKLAAKEIERQYVKKCNKREYKRKKKKIIFVRFSDTNFTHSSIKVLLKG